MHLSNMHPVTSEPISLHQSVGLLSSCLVFKRYMKLPHSFPMFLAQQVHEARVEIMYTRFLANVSFISRTIL